VPITFISVSGNASRARGRQRELRYRDHLREQGYWCERIDSAADLVAAREGQVPTLIQVKSTLGRYSCFLPAERQAVLAEAERAGFHAALVWWPKGKGIHDAEWIPSSDWPS
jgi:hypothetical protein